MHIEYTPVESHLLTQNLLNWDKNNFGTLICLFLPVNSLLLHKNEQLVPLLSYSAQVYIYIPILKYYSL